LTAKEKGEENYSLKRKWKEELNSVLFSLTLPFSLSITTDLFPENTLLGEAAAQM